MNEILEILVELIRFLHEERKQIERRFERLEEELLELRIAVERFKHTRTHETEIR